MPIPTFSAEDAKQLIDIAQDAPIPGGARQAAARSDLYQRFVSFYEQVEADKAKAVKAPRKPRKVAPASPDTTAGDVTA